MPAQMLLHRHLNPSFALPIPPRSPSSSSASPRRPPAGAHSAAAAALGTRRRPPAAASPRRPPMEVGDTGAYDCTVVENQAAEAIQAFMPDARAYWVTSSLIAWNVCDQEAASVCLYASRGAGLHLSPSNRGIQGYDSKVELQPEHAGLPESVRHITDLIPIGFLLCCVQCPMGCSVFFLLLRLDFTYETNNWGVGLPPSEKNEDNWPVIKPRLENPSFKPAKRHILAALDSFVDILKIRYSSPLFHLRTASDIKQRVHFHNTGPSAVPGVIVMSIEDARNDKPEMAQLDANFSYAVTVFNVCPYEVSIDIPALASMGLELHPVQANSSDALVRQSAYKASTGRFSVPRRTASVFVELRR